MRAPRIVLAGVDSKVHGLRWEFERSVRIGRQGNLDLVLRDYSVERLHAEIKHGGARWIVRDLADNARFPTLINGSALEGRYQELRLNDFIQIGSVTLRVAELDRGQPDMADPFARPDAQHLQASSACFAAPSSKPQSHTDLQVATTAQHTWEQALEWIALKDRAPLQGRAMLTLLRANHHLASLSSLDELLHSILDDAINSLGAQRGAILLADPDTGQLVLKASAAPALPTSIKSYSKTLAERCFRHGESSLCQDTRADEALTGARSVKHGAMASVICTVLRTPRKSLGVLHLDRGVFQSPFTAEDLYLADAMSASVAVGIECAQLVELQRDQFVQTVTTLARAVEMRDQYTGDHTRRVTDYALLLADELKIGSAERYQIQIGTPLHDIGKIGIDDAILRKPGKLTAAEFDAMKTHTLKGAAILESIGSLNPMIPIVRHHHERWDGAGYPDGLSRDNIDVTARIVAVADAFDAMTSRRPYRPAMPAQLAFLELLSQAGTHFDPSCVQAFMRLRGKVEERLRQQH